MAGSPVLHFSVDPDHTARDHPPMAHFDTTSAEPYDFTAESGDWAWFRSWEVDEIFEDDEEQNATLPPPLLDALEGHATYDPVTSSIKAYPTRGAALDALTLAIIRRAATFVEPVTVDG